MQDCVGPCGGCRNLHGRSVPAIRDDTIDAFLDTASDEAFEMEEQIL